MQAQSRSGSPRHGGRLGPELPAGWPEGEGQKDKQWSRARISGPTGQDAAEVLAEQPVERADADRYGERSAAGATRWRPERDTDVRHDHIKREELTAARH